MRAPTGERPDFEPIASWGSKAGVSDPEAVIYLHHLCDLFGIDSVSAGNAVAFAMDLWEQGILTAEDTGGLEIAWGDVTVMETLVRQMAAGEGFGALLGRGVREAARVIGRGAERYAYHVKGLELTAFDPRGASAAGLGYAVSNRGGDFTSVYARHEFSLTPAQGEALYGDERASDRTSPVGKAAMVKRSMVICAVLDSIGLCKIPALTLVNEFDLVSEADLVSAVAGMPVTPDELFVIGERIVDIERLFNARFGCRVRGRHPAGLLPGGTVGGRSRGGEHHRPGSHDRRVLSKPWAGPPGECRRQSTLHRLGLETLAVKT